MNIKTVLTLSLAVLIFGGTQLYGQSASKQAGRKTTLGKIVPNASATAMGSIDHSGWNDLLAKYVDESGGVDYKTWHASQQCTQALDTYIDLLSSASLTQGATKADQMAYWINAYNAVTIKGILQEYPTTSIRNHTSENGGYNIWKNLLLNIGGRQVSLEGIEHQVLRKMGDPRIHFAIVCASKGCPRLLNEAYVGSTLNDQLATNTKHFFSLAQNFQHDVQNRSFRLSAIMQWFGSDFGQDQAAQLRAISKYLPTQQAQAAANANAVGVSYLDYSWDLNIGKPKMNMIKKGSGAKEMGGSGQKQGSMKKQGSTQKQASGMKKTGGSGSR